MWVLATEWLQKKCTTLNVGNDLNILFGAKKFKRWANNTNTGFREFVKLFLGQNVALILSATKCQK